MLLIANRPFYEKEIGRILADQSFEEPDVERARKLCESGLARRPAPRIIYQTKVVIPEAPAVTADAPFRLMHLSDPEPDPLPPDSDPVLSESDLSEEGITHRRGRRRGRKAHHSAR